jgi:hypothetical protein
VVDQLAASLGPNMNWVFWIEVLALCVAIAAAYLSVRPQPALDWERLFKISLATTIRGEVESGGGDSAAWWARVKGVVFYQPAAQRPAVLLAAPDLDTIPVPAREGERALTAALMASPEVGARWAMMFEADAARGALLQDPVELGAAYDPVKVFAPGVGWDEIAAWSVALQDALNRRLSELVVIASSPWCEHLAAAAPHARVVPLSLVGEDPHADAESIGEHLSNAADRCIILSDGEHVRGLLAALHGVPRLRDRVLAVFNLGGELDAAWLDAHFQHEQFDTELNRRTGYFSLIDVDPAAPLARDWGGQRFPEPPVPRTGWTPIEPIDLGPVPLSTVGPELLMRALWVVIAFRLARE